MSVRVSPKQEPTSEGDEHEQKPDVSAIKKDLEDGELLEEGEVSDDDAGEADDAADSEDVKPPKGSKGGAGKTWEVDITRKLGLTSLKWWDGMATMPRQGSYGLWV